MPQITKGDTFADGQQVTGTRLNQLIDSAVITSSVITDQTNIAVNGVASNDSLLVYDLSATALREANVSDVLGSNVPVTTSQITAGNASDVTISPQNGTLVAGSAFTSADGLTVVVTSNAHGLVAGQVVTTTASTVAGYNGTHKITAVTTNTFTYVMTVAGTIGSGTISYTKQGVVKITANEVISNNLYVDGNTNITGNANITGALNVTGSVNGTSAIKIATGTTAERPASPVAGQLRFNTTSNALEVYSGTTWINGVTSGSANFDGTVNITGAIQYNGKPVYGVYEWYDAYNYLSSGTHVGYNGQKLETTSANHTKGAGERWSISVSVAFYNYDSTYRLVIKGSNNVVYYTSPYLAGVGSGYDVRSGTVNLTSQEFTNIKFYALVEQQGNTINSFADASGAGNIFAEYNKIAIEKWITA